MRKLFIPIAALTLTIGCSADVAETSRWDEIAVGSGEGDQVELPEQRLLQHSCAEDKQGDASKPMAASGGISSLGVTSNTYGLAVEILNPFEFTMTTSPSWGPPGHHTPWGGDWAGDLWRDAGGGGLGNTCGVNVHMKARIVQVPGGQIAHEVRARVLAEGYACASQVYNQGGYMQKIGIEARYNSTWYDLGWVLYAHLDNMVYNQGDVFDPYDAILGTSFQGGVIGSCWGSCHTHVEFNNTQGTSCYELLPPTSGIGVTSQIGVIGGNLSGGNCNVPSGGTNNAEVQEGASSVPASMTAGTTQNVTVRLYNNGTTTWKKSTLHRLGATASNGVTWTNFGACGGYSVNPTNSRVELCSDVPPGGTYNATFGITAPSGVSSTTLSVRMVQDGVAWFGETQSFPITVTTGGGSCSCSGGATYWGSQVPASSTYCGFKVCGGDNQLYSCGTSGWTSAGGSPCNCRCTGGSDYQGNPVNPDFTYCGFNVCGGDHQIYQCNSGGWSAQGTSCP